MRAATHLSCLLVSLLASLSFAASLSPKIYAPGVLSTDQAQEWAFAFAVNNQTIYIQRGDFERYTLFESQQRNGKWTQPEVVSFAQEGANDSDAFISPDGTHLYFSTNRVAGGGTKKDFDIWVVDKTANGWKNPRPLSKEINSDSNEWLPSVSEKGNLYFESDRPGGQGKTDLYVADMNEKSPARLLPKNINTSEIEESPFIAPDETYLIFQRNSSDLFISFARANQWTDPQKLPLPNSSLKYSPYVSPDKKHFFYTSNERGTSDIYVVDAKFLGIK